MRLVLFSILFALVLINQTLADEKPFIIVIGNANSVMSRGVNAEVKVRNDNKITVVESSFGSIEINNELVDPKNGFVVEGNGDLDQNNCKSGPLANIIIKCSGKLLVRMRKADDKNLLGGFNFIFGGGK